jgi:hypothetical protein
MMMMVIIIDEVAHYKYASRGAIQQYINLAVLIKCKEIYEIISRRDFGVEKEDPIGRSTCVHASSNIIFYISNKISCKMSNHGSSSIMYGAH